MASPTTTGTDERDREAMVLRHMPLARRLARRYAHNPGMAEDLLQVAALGLVRAVDRFDPERGVAFSSFAIPTILGEIKRHFRDTRWAVHLPRELQERAQRVERTADRLTALLGREPRPRDVANALGLSVEEVLEAQEAFSGFDARSLDAPAGDEDAATAAELLGDEDPGYELVEGRVSIEPAMAQLSTRDRTALQLRFEYDMTQSEIGRHLGISQMQVSRILRRALAQVAQSV